jgi:DNA polymerase III epsilon subunit-like protein
MSNILFFDTETTGLIPRIENTNNYPRLVQLSALLYSETGNLLQTFDCIVKPNGFSIPNSEIHGINDKIANSKGVDISIILLEFKEICKKANLIVCNNYAFDSLIIKSELRRINQSDFISAIPSFCTMTECSSLSNSISLNNLYKSLFNIDIENQHNSFNDVNATAKCFFELINQRKLQKRGINYIFNLASDENIQFELDKENTKFYNAFSFIENTKNSIFLTGKAGTGKTTFLKYLRNNLNKKIVSLAPTGVAAINAGGQTINSFFQLPFRPFLPDDSQLQKDNIYKFLKYTTNKRDIIRSIDILVIDEVSMVRADIIDAIDKILRNYRNKFNTPFGGVQLLFIGDLFQLPPIEGDEWNVIRDFYKSPYFFDSKIIEELINKNEFAFIELDKVYRQTEIEFIEILNRIRVGQHTANDLLKLNRDDNKVSNINTLLSNNYIVLSTTNPKVNNFNESKLNEIDLESFEFEGKTEGDFPDSMKIAPQVLKFKVGAQVMLLKNLGGRNYNGKIGKIVKLETDSIEVLFDGSLNSEKIDKAIWTKIEYRCDKEKNKIEEIVKGTYVQYPLKLAWAITVNKSQGLTFNKVIADVGSSFASGQVYVALSRATSLSGLKFISPLPNHAIMIDKRVINFSNMQTPETTIVNFINEGKADSFYKSFRKSLLENYVDDAFSSLEEAVKFRNDIFSDTFKKFVKVYISKYQLYKNFILTLRKLINDSFLEIEKLKKDYFDLEIEFSDFKKSNQSALKKQNIESQKLKLEIEKLKNEYQTAKNEITLLNKENKKLSENCKELNDRIQITNNGLSRKNNEIIDLTKKNNELITQLNKLKSKWFVKVFD